MNLLFVAPIICLILKITAAEQQYFNDFKICGKSISKFGRIIGNEEAKPGDFPWQAALRRRNSEMPYCGATLISNQWLITAAHCNVAVGHYVVLGANNLRQSYEGTRQYFRVKFIKSHPSYKKKYHDYDIALIELDRPAIYTNYVRPTCIANNATTLDKNTVAFLSGWGRLRFGARQYKLQKAEVKIAANSKCVQTYRQRMTRRMICAATSCEDTCPGDSGGPLVVDLKKNQQFSLAGIVSWGRGCTLRNVQDVYTNVAALHQWIQAELECKQVYPKSKEIKLVPLYRYYNPKIVDHFYTASWTELGNGKDGWKSEGVQCRIMKFKASESVPLYRYWKNGRDHFYTTNIKEIGTATPGNVGNHGYKSEGITGYCYPVKKAGTIPLYRYWQPRYVNHFYTTNAKGIGTTTPGQVGKHGYKSEGITCYVFPN